MESKLKLGLVLLVVGLFVATLGINVSAVRADYYFHPQCGHCEQIKPFMLEVSKHFNINWVDTSEPKSYPISGTPTVIVHASDGRQVKLAGSLDIPKYLPCELQEQSTLECMTTSYLNCSTNSYFVRD